MRPFVFPAMGSHGAATAKGQAEILARYGISDGIQMEVNPNQEQSER